MPGPRLEARTSNPQPIVVQNGVNPVQQLASLAKQGAALYNQYQEGEDNEFLKGIRNQIQTIKAGVANDPSTRGAAIIRVDKLLNDALNVEGKSHLAPELNAMNRGFDTDAGINLIDAQRKAVAAAKQEELDEVSEQYAALNIIEGSPDSEQRFNQAMNITQETARLVRENAYLEAKGNITKKERTSEGFAVGATMYNNAANSWRNLVGTTEQEFSEKTPEEVQGILSNIKQTIRTATANIDLKYGDKLSPETRAQMLKPLLDEAAFVTDIVNGVTSFESYTNRNKYNSSVAQYMEAPTPSILLLNKLNDKLLSSPRPELWLDLVADDQLMRVLKGNSTAFLSRLVSGDPKLGATAFDLVEDTNDRSKMAASIMTGLKAAGAETPDEMANILANIAAPMALDPTIFNTDAWDAMVSYVGSETGKSLVGNATFSAFLGTVDQGLGNYGNTLLSSAKAALPAGVIVSIANGRVSVELDLSIQAEKSQAHADARVLENWRQNYGTRINALAQAGAALRGGTPQETLDALTTKSGLLSGVEPKNEAHLEEALAELEVAYGRGN